MPVSSGPAARIGQQAGLLVPLSSSLREVNLEEAVLRMRVCFWRKEVASVQSSCGGCVCKGAQPAR